MKSFAFGTWKNLFAIHHALVLCLSLLPVVHGSSVRGGQLDASSHRQQLAADNATSESTPAHDRYGMKLIRGVPKIKVRKAGTIGGGSSEYDDLDTGPVLTVNCFEPFPGPEPGSRCPTACPYMRFDPDRMCHFKCITREWCLTAKNMPSSFPNDETGQCVTCQVPGCAKCVSPTQCESGMCHNGFDMVNGECLPQSRFMWRTIIIVLAIVVSIFALYLGRIASRPIRQPILSKLGMAFRSMSKLRHEEAPHPLYSIFGTNLCNQLVSGVGVLLHFRFQAFWLIWAFIVLLSAGLLSIYHGRFKADDVLASSPTHEEVFRSCSQFGSGQARHVVTIQQNFTWFTLAVYVCTTIACILFAIMQQRAYFDEEALNTTMEDFGLCVYHMPVEPARDTIEKEYTDFFKKTFGEKNVIGVSICWNYKDNEEYIINQATTELHQMDKEFDGEFLSEEEKTRLYTPGWDTGGAASGKDEREGCAVPELRCLDNALIGSSLDTLTGEVLSPHAKPDEVKALVQGLSTTGIVFVVFNSEADQLEALEFTKEQAQAGEPITYEGKPIGISREQWDPATLLWTGFAVHKTERNLNILKGIATVGLVIVVWALCFYGPYVVYVLSWAKVAGNSQGDANTMSLLGLMCAVGNQVVYFTCAKVADNVGFRSKDFAMTFNCCLYTLAVFINIVVDVSLMLVMAHGYQQDSGMDPQATIRNPSFQYSLYIQLVTYLYPMTLLAPYLAEPLPMNIIPYFLSKWMVRSAFSISRYDAEQALVCPEFDLLRYGDIIINVSTVIVCFFLASSSLWWIFMWLFVSNLVIYLWDHFRFLRCCQETFFANDLMEVCSQLISALPCALLAAAYVFKRYEGEELIKSWYVHQSNEDIIQKVEQDFRVSLEDINHSLWASVIGVFLAHLVIHTLVVKLIVPKFLPKDEHVSNVPYSVYSKHMACNWFNSNPVHCLRSTYIHKHYPPFIYFMRGKEYTHKRNEDIHQYYEEHEVVDADKGVQDEFSDAVKRKASSVTEFGKAVTHSIQGKLRIGRRNKLQSANQANDSTSDSVEGGCQIL